MPAVEHVPVSQPLQKASDPAVISKPIASQSPRLATFPLPTSSSSTISQEDESDKPSVSDKSEPESDPTPPESKIPPINTEIIHEETFLQILELDEEDSRDFSFPMVEAYFEQAEGTFRDLDENFKDENLAKLSELGHFLKGSSAAIGLHKVQASCEKIQHYGAKFDQETDKDLKPEDALGKIKNQLKQLREEYTEAKQCLEDWFRLDEECQTKN